MVVIPSELVSATIAFLLLLGSIALGVFIRARLPERHRTPEATQLMHVTINLLVTFAALVLGLLTATVKQDFDRTAHDWEGYTRQLSILDDCLRDYGTQTAEIRNDLHGYVATVIANTWRDQPPPPLLGRSGAMPAGADTSTLGALISQIGTSINRLTPVTTFQHQQFAMCFDRYQDVLSARLRVIEDSRAGLFQPFYTILMFWLMTMFACFGLVAPINRVTGFTIMLCAVSLSSVVFVILDLGTPYTGWFSIPSAGMREALAMMQGS